MSPESPREPLPPVAQRESPGERTSTVAEPPFVLEVIESTIDHAVGTFGNVSIYVFRRQTLPSSVPAVVRAFDDARRAGGGTFANYGVIEPEAPLPEPNVRAQLAHLMRDAEGINASAVIFEGTGFRAAAVRVVTTGMALVARQPYPHRVFSSTTSAAEWTAAQMARRGLPCPIASELDKAVQALRSTTPTRPLQEPFPRQSLGRSDARRWRRDHGCPRTH